MSGLPDHDHPEALSEERLGELELLLFNVDDGEITMPVQRARALLQAAREREELSELFAIQRKRMDEATKAWREAHPGNDLVVPDLGKLLSWLLAAHKRAPAHGEPSAAERSTAEMTIKDSDTECLLAGLHDGVLDAQGIIALEFTLVGLDAKAKVAAFDRDAALARAEAAEKERDEAQASVLYYEEAVCMKGNPLALPVDGTETEAVQVERVAEVLKERDQLRAQLAQVTKERDAARSAVDRFDPDVSKSEALALLASERSAGLAAQNECVLLLSQLASSQANVRALAEAGKQAMPILRAWEGGAHGLKSMSFGPADNMGFALARPGVRKALETPDALNNP